VGKHSKPSHLRRSAGMVAATTAVGAGSLLGGPSALAATPAPAVPAGDAQLVDGTPCTVTAKACVDLDSHQAWLISAGKVVGGPVEMMPGAPDEPTPVGTFSVLWKDKNHVSEEYPGAQMPNSVFFTDGGVAFHEGSLTRFSAGCVHLSKADSESFYDYLQVGDQVQVHDGS
jgi:lipoprotein-anchoring transpeptidase ErfK/SrfK